MTDTSLERFERRLLPRPTLIFMMGAVLAIALWLAWVANAARRQRLAVAVIRQGSGFVENLHHVETALATGKSVFADSGIVENPSPLMTWLRRELGPDYFETVAAVRLYAPTRASLQAAGKLPGLRVLELRDRRQQILDDDLLALRPLRHLHTLRIWFARLSGTGLARLSELAGLEKLDLTFAQIDEADLRHLAGLKTLKTLIVGQTTIGGTGLRHLGSLSQIQRLYLDGTKLTDDDLAGLASMTALRELSLASVPITDAALVHLHRLPALSKVDLRATLVTPQGVAALKKAIPTLQVRYP